jgi:hypothetical protein
VILAQCFAACDASIYVSVKQCLIRLALFVLNLLLHHQLYESYKDVQFSKKHQGDYLKYTPEAIEGGIEELFQG